MRFDVPLSQRNSVIAGDLLHVYFLHLRREKCKKEKEKVDELERYEMYGRCNSSGLFDELWTTVEPSPTCIACTSCIFAARARARVCMYACMRVCASRPLDYVTGIVDIIMFLLTQVQYACHAIRAASHVNPKLAWAKRVRFITSREPWRYSREFDIPRSAKMRARYARQVLLDFPSSSSSSCSSSSRRCMSRADQYPSSDLAGVWSEEKRPCWNVITFMT